MSICTSHSEKEHYIHVRCPYMTGEMVFFSYSLEAYGLELVSIYVYQPKEYGHIHIMRV